MFVGLDEAYELLKVKDEPGKPVFLTLKQLVVLRICLMPQVYTSNAHEALIDFLELSILENWTDEEFEKYLSKDMADWFKEDRKELQEMGQAF